VSTNYYLVCDKHRSYLPFWRRTAGGTGPYATTDSEREAVQDFLYAHLECAIGAVSEHDDGVWGDDYVRAHDGDDEED
jgi:hypothetical protein